MNDLALIRRILRRLVRPEVAWLIALGCAASTGPAAAAAGEVERGDAEIQFWDSRAERDPADHLSPTKLGNLLVRQARRTGDARLYGRAEQALKTALTRNPAHQPAMVSLASVYLSQHRFSEAREMARAAVDADGDDPEARGALGDACLETGDLAGAEQQYAKLMQGPPSLFAYSRVANLHHAKGDTTDATNAFIKALEAGEASGAPAEDRAWCMVQIGGLAFARGDWDAAEAQYLSALKLVPDAYAATDHLAELRAAQKRYDEAVALYQKVVAAVPRPEYFQALGDVLSAAGRRADARPWYDKARVGYLQAVTSGDAHYFHHLAGFFADVEKDGAQAVKWARRDIEGRRTVATLDALAWSLHVAGEFSEAATVMGEALSRGTADAHVLYHASLIFFRSGEPSRAKDCLARAAAKNPKFGDFHVHR